MLIGFWSTPQLHMVQKAPTASFDFAVKSRNDIFSILQWMPMIGVAGLRAMLATLDCNAAFFRDQPQQQTRMYHYLL